MILIVAHGLEVTIEAILRKSNRLSLKLISTTYPKSSCFNCKEKSMFDLVGRGTVATHSKYD
jgi:hypothetical protein